MMHPANEKRVSRARIAIAPYGNGDTRDDICDLLANLMHLCDCEGLDFDEIAESARMHFAAESGEGDDIEQGFRATEYPTAV